MALTLDETRKIATLARLRFTPEEEVVYARQLGQIVDYIDQLQRFETGESDPGVTPPVREEEDRPHACLPREIVLANAPASALGEYLVVPEVKGGGEDAA